MSYVISGLIPTTGTILGGSQSPSTTEFETHTGSAESHPGTHSLAHSAAQSGTHASRADLIHSHLRLAESVARKHSFGHCESADMRQVAYMGLVKAAERFDPHRGYDFASFAAPTIAGECKRYLRDHGWMVRPPRAVQDLRHNLVLESARLTQELRREPSADDLAQALDAPREAVRESIAAHSSMQPDSLEQLDPTGERGSSIDVSAMSGTDGFDQLEMADALARACDTLSPRDRRVLHMRFVEERTQAQIGDELGVTQMQVSRILRRIVGDLRTTLRSC